MLFKFREKLEIEKSESIKAENYEYTDQVNQKIDEMKKTLSTERKRQLVIQHGVELDALDNAYKYELEEFNNAWDNKFRSLEEKGRSLEDNLSLKHENGMKELFDYLEKHLPKTAKFSKAYIDTKNQEENLVKLQRFKEASFLKKRLEELEKADTQKFEKDKYDKIKSESAKTANKHTIEKSALRKKIEMEFEVLKKERQYNLEKLLLKYKNRKVELENQQKQELVYLENENLLKKSKKN